MLRDRPKEDRDNSGREKERENKGKGRKRTIRDYFQVKKERKKDAQINLGPLYENIEQDMRKKADGSKSMRYQIRYLMNASIYQERKKEEAVERERGARKEDMNLAILNKTAYENVASAELNLYAKNFWQTVQRMLQTPHI